jgi:6-pyruvoyltetrahydropterin/6-carboxytetrahydropterin synthase
MIAVTKEMTFEAAHRLRFHEGACRNIHGHSYRARVSVCWATENEDATQDQGPATGMILDFGKIKAAMTTVLLTGDGYPDGKPRVPFDHALVLNEDDPMLNYMSCAPLTLGLRLFPMTTEPTAENMAKLIAQLVQLVLGPPFCVFLCELWETASSCATWEM